jgi:riboflavin kinase/FMN adenylyltransferase
MKVLRSIAELSTMPSPLVLAVGVFDGVHIGHRAVIQRALMDARSLGNGQAVVVTFDPHPARVLRPELAPRLLTCNAHKQQIIKRLGVETLLVLSFDREMAQTAAESFVRNLRHAAPQLRQICVGAGWVFGKGRSGNLALLQRLGAELNFEAVGIPDVTVGGLPVSSTAVRAAVEQGNLELVRDMLGRDFSILGTVIHGRSLGKQIGFPTANLQSNNEHLPPNGVYSVRAQLLQDGREFNGVANIGVRPTVSDSDERTCEVHLFDFEGEIYSQQLEVHFKSYIRAEQKFATVDALRGQIAEDVRLAKSKAG